MTPKEQAAMQQALECAERCESIDGMYSWADTITALREALEQPENQEPNSTFMEGYRIGLAEMREKCATVSEQGTGEAVQKTALELLLNERKRIAAAIRAIKFEGDTGFRPVSEMIAEHKQDPKKAEPQVDWQEEALRLGGLNAKHVGELRKLKAEQAEQEPVAYVYEKDVAGIGMRKDVAFTKHVEVGTDLYAAPVRTKDLTDVADLQDAVTKALKKAFHLGQTYWQQADSESYAANKRANVTQELYWKLEGDTRAAIAADRELNK